MDFASCTDVRIKPNLRFLKKRIILSLTDIVETGRRKKICSIITLEGGHNIANSLAVLRMYYDLGVRSMALTNKDCSTPW